LLAAFDSFEEPGKKELLRHTKPIFTD